MALDASCEKNSPYALFHVTCSAAHWMPFWSSTGTAEISPPGVAVDEAVDSATGTSQLLAAPTCICQLPWLMRSKIASGCVAVPVSAWPQPRGALVSS